MSDRSKGILCILSAAFCFALMSVFVRLAGDIPSVQKSFFRNLVSLAFALLLMLKNHTTFEVKKEARLTLLLRSAAGTVGILCNFYAVDHIPLADASALGKMSPFFTLLFSALLLHEAVTPVQLAAVAVAFGGSMFILRPDFANADLLPSAAALLGGLAAGLAYTMVRKLGKMDVPGTQIVFYFSLFSCLCVAPYLVFSFAPMTWPQVGMLLLAGLAASGGQFSVTFAYRFAPANQISVYDYSQIVFSALLGFFFFSQMPDLLSVVGYAIICGAAVFMFFYNNRRAVAR